MQPTDQTSTNQNNSNNNYQQHNYINISLQQTDNPSLALKYALGLSMISGALYHRVATYSVKVPL